MAVKVNVGKISEEEVCACVCTETNMVQLLNERVHKT